MSSSTRRYIGFYTGAAADITVASCPFRPEVIRFNTVAAAEFGVKTSAMTTNVYVSHAGADTGVTINDNGFTVDNGADVNHNGVVTHYVCEAS